MASPHENTVDGTRLDTQGAEHTFRVVDRKTRYGKAFSLFDTLFPNVDAIYRAGLRTLVTGNTGR